MAELTPLSILITADADDLKAEIAAAKTAIAKFETQASKGGTKAKGFGATLSSLGNISNSTRAKIQLTSFQLQDIIVQLQGGTKASTALAQQLPQMAGAFGAVGAVVGVLAGIGIPMLALAFSDAGTDGKKLEEVMGDLEEAVGNVDAASTIALSSLEELRKKYGENAGAVRDLFRALVAVNQQQALNAMQASIIAASDELDGLTGAVGDFSQARRELLEAKDLIDIGLGPLPSEIKAMEQAVSDAAAHLEEEFGLTSAQAYRIVDALHAVDSAAGPEQAAGAAQQLALAISQAAAEGAQLDGTMASVASSAARAYAAFSEVIRRGKEASAAMSNTNIGSGWEFDPSRDMPPGPKDPKTRRGGGGGAKDTTEAELQKLQELLMSKEELEIASFERQQQLLQESLEKKLITQEEYNALMEDAQSRHAQRMAAVYSAQGDSALATTLGSASDVLSAMGAFNDKAFKLAKVAGAAQALVSTLQGAAEALKLPYPLNLAAAASVMAKGLGLVAAIKGVSGGGSGAAAASTGALAADPVQPGQNIVIDFKGDTFSKQGGIALIESINDALRDGGQIDGILAR